MSSARRPDITAIMQSYIPTILVHPPVLRHTEAGCIASLNLGCSNLPEEPEQQALHIKMLASYMVWLNKEGVVAFMLQDMPAPETQQFEILANKIESLNPGVLDIEAMKQAFKVTREKSTGTSCLLQKDKLSYNPQNQEHARTPETTSCDVYTLTMLDGTAREFHIVNMDGDSEDPEQTVESIYKALMSNFMICGDWNIEGNGEDCLPRCFKSLGSTSADSSNNMYGFYDAASLVLKRQEEYHESEIFLYFRKNNRLDKRQFMSALHYYWAAHLFRQNRSALGQSPVASMIAENAWSHYQQACSMFESRHYSVNKLKKMDEFSLERLPELQIHTFIQAVDIQYTRGDLQALTDPYFPAYLLKPIIDLPRFVWRNETAHEESFIPGNSQLMTHVSNSDYKKVSVFIKLGADVNQYSAKEGNTPLLLAVSKGWNHQDFDEHGGSRSQFYARHYPQKEIIKSLLFHNADVNAIHLANGMTALHIACLRGDSEDLIKLLLENDADVNAKDYSGRTPFDMLSCTYEVAQTVISSMAIDVMDMRCLQNGTGIESLRFGTQGQPENRSDTATLPTRYDRASNVFKIRRMLEVNQQKAKTPTR